MWHVIHITVYVLYVSLYKLQISCNIDTSKVKKAATNWPIYQFCVVLPYGDLPLSVELP